MASGIFEELMRNFYELADGSSKLLNIRKQYDLNPTGPIAKKLLKKSPKITNEAIISTAIKNVRIYSQIYQKNQRINCLD